MKKLMSLFLAMILALSICSAALADDPNEAPGTVTMPYSGIVFTPPASFQNAAGMISTDGDMELEKGVNYAYWAYYAMKSTSFRTDRISNRSAAFWYSDPSPVFRAVVSSSVVMA